MNSDNAQYQSINEYRAVEAEFHREMLNLCRKYMNYLGIVSMVGIIDIVKRESVELEKATKKDISIDAMDDNEGNLKTLQ